MPWYLRRFLEAILFACTALAATTQPTLAIPSPELVVGSLSSLSQLTALLSAIFGGGALAFGSRLAKGRKGAADTRRIEHIALACFAAALCGFGLAIHEYRNSAFSERTRLEQTLLRPTPKAAEGKTLDPLLKEITFSKQVMHPRGLTTDEASQIITGAAANNAPGWMILDIRETAETEMGSLAGAVKIRFPDLQQSRIDFTDKKALLICHNGNRSAETCEALAAKGVDCRFIAGGLEKWLAEGRTLEGSKVRTIDDLRALPAYPNQSTLLDTAQVHELVDKDGAIFVDVRYAGEFASGHLPGAINVPIRPTPTHEFAALIEALPDKPVIAPCYDRRSCFFGEILGLTLSRAGRDFRGRYTVPWGVFRAIQAPAPRGSPACRTKQDAVDARGRRSRHRAGRRRGEDGTAGRASPPGALVALARDAVLAQSGARSSRHQRHQGRCGEPEGETGRRSATPGSSTARAL